MSGSSLQAGHLGPTPLFRPGFRTVGDMTVQRMDHVGIVVDDLAAATAFSAELGLVLQGEGPVAGHWVDRVVGLEGVRADIARMQTPDGNGRLRCTVEAATGAQRQLFTLIIAAPEPVRARFRGLKLPGMLSAAAGLRIRSSWDVETTRTVTVLRCLARRARTLAQEAVEHGKAVLAIVRSWRPDLLAQPGVGPIVAATVPRAWSHPRRIRSEAAFADVAPIPATSGQVTTRHRLNRYGDRRLNRALDTVIALSRIRCDPTTGDYVIRRAI